MAGESCPKQCVLYSRECIDCGECNRCDLDPSKQCDNCMKCVNNGKDYRAVVIDDICLPGSSEYHGNSSDADVRDAQA